MSSPATAEEQPVVAVDLGRTKILSALVRGEAIEDRRERRSDSDDFSVLLELAVLVAAELAADHPEAQAVGLSIAGDIGRDGVVYHRRVDEGDRAHVGSGELLETPLAEQVFARTGLPAFVENDGTAAALAEWQLGAAFGADDLVCFTVGTHIGSGVVCGGQVVHRRTSGPLLGGVVSLLGPLAEGQTAIVGDRCSGSGLEQRYRERGGEEMAAKEILARAARGERLAREAADEAAFWLGLLCASSANVFAPAVVVLGGGVMESWDVLAPGLLAVFERETTLPTVTTRRPQIKKARFGAEAPLLGAAVAATKHMR